MRHNAMATRSVPSERPETGEEYRKRAEELTKTAATLTDRKERESLLRQALDCEVEALTQGRNIQWPSHSLLKASDEADMSENPSAVSGQSSGIPSVQAETRREDDSDAEESNVEPLAEPAASSDSDENAGMMEHPDDVDCEEGSEIGLPETGKLETVETVEVTVSSTGGVEGQKPKKKPRKLEVKAKKKPRKIEVRSEAKSP